MLALARIGPGVGKDGFEAYGGRDENGCVGDFFGQGRAFLGFHGKIINGE